MNNKSKIQESLKKVELLYNGMPTVLLGDLNDRGKYNFWKKGIRDRKSVV